MTDIYRVHANYPNAMTGEVFIDTLKNLPGIIRNSLNDPENFNLEITNDPIIYDNNGVLDIDCAQNMQFYPCTMEELDEWAK